MFVSMKMIFYICTVKSIVRYISAALRSICIRYILVNRYSRIKVCGSSNAHKVFAQWNLTAPWTAFCLMSKFIVL